MKKRLFLVSIMTMLLCCCSNGKKTSIKESEKVSYCLEKLKEKYDIAYFGYSYNEIKLYTYYYEKLSKDNLVSAYDFNIYEKDTKSYICILEYKNESRLNVVNFECGRNYVV